MNTRVINCFLRPLANGPGYIRASVCYRCGPRSREFAISINAHTLDGEGEELRER